MGKKQGPKRISDPTKNTGSLKFNQNELYKQSIASEEIKSGAIEARRSKYGIKQNKVTDSSSQESFDSG